MESYAARTERVYEELKEVTSSAQFRYILEKEFKAVQKDQAEKLIESLGKGVWGHRKITFSQWFYSMIILCFKPKIFFNSVFAAIQQEFVKKLQKESV